MLLHDGYAKADRFIGTPHKQGTAAAALQLNPLAAVYRVSPGKSINLQPVPRKPVVIKASRVLEVPGLEDDYYTQMLGWSSKNLIAVALHRDVYLYSPVAGATQILGGASGGAQGIASVAWSAKGDFLAVGGTRGAVAIWNTQTLQCTHRYEMHSHRIATMAWSGDLLTTGSKDTTIRHTDTRARGAAVCSQWHSGEVCGLKWDKNGANLLSGGDDNQVCVWDVRDTSRPTWSIGDFRGAVKALDWSPNDASLFSTGGGSTDRKLKVWSLRSLACEDVVDTGSQICSLLWTRNHNQIVTSHGFIENDLSVWRYPNLKKAGTMPGHRMRVLHLAASPDHSTVASTSGDQTLRFWSLSQGSQFMQNRTAGLGVLK